MIIEEWARHILESDFRALDAETIEHAKKRIIDVVGCIIGGIKSLKEGWGSKTSTWQ